MRVDFKIPYERKSVSPATEVVFFCVALVVAVLWWFL